MPKFYVMDDTDNYNAVYVEDLDSGGAFSTWEDAEAKAKELALENPKTTYVIAEATDKVAVPPAKSPRVSEYK